MDNHHTPNGTHPQGQQPEDLLEALITDLQAERRPTLPLSLEPEEAELVQMAALLHGTLARDVTPNTDFASRLQARLERDLFPIIETAPLPTPMPKRAGPTRRGILRTGLVAAVGLAAGVVGGGIVAHSDSGQAGPWPPIVGEAGIWLAVAPVTDIAPGSAMRFVTPNLIGHLVRYSDGSFTAFSAACTHMGCITNWNAGQHTFDCPCHNGRFDDHGQAITNRPAYRPLPQILTRITNDQVEVFVPQSTTLPPTATPTSGTPTPGGYNGG